MSPETVTIIDRRTNQPVEAALHTSLDELTLIDVEIVWAPERLRGLRRLRERRVSKQQIPQHVHWNWAMRAVRHSGLLAYRSFGIEVEGNMQGLMMVCLSGCLAQLDPDRGKPLVYVDFLETAPWNAKEFADVPIYKGVGLRLMQAAVRLSSNEGFSGRVGLHALSQSKPFYAGACGMAALGADAGYHGLEYFELTAAQAAEFLKD
jgi:hypothetical protein